MKLRFLGLVVLAIAVMSAAAFASPITFSCPSGVTACTGTIVATGTPVNGTDLPVNGSASVNYSSSGITVVEFSGPLAGDTGTFTFNTNGGAIAISDIGGNPSESLVGTFASFNVNLSSTDTIDFNNVFFPGPLPSDFATFLCGSPSCSASGSGGDAIALSFSNNVGAVSAANLTVVGTPEPASIMLFGSGLLGLAGVVRRKRAR